MGLFYRSRGEGKEQGELSLSLLKLNQQQHFLSLFDVTIDALVGNVEEDQKIIGVAPKGKYFFGMAKIGEDGSVVLPKKALDVFSLKPGNELAILGDEDRGFALVPKKQITDMFSLVEK